MRKRDVPLLGLARGKTLTALAEHIYGVKRKRWLWIFKESDAKLVARCRAKWDELVLK